MPTATKLLTAEEFGRLPDNGQPMELVRGRIVTMNVPYPRHGEICSNVVFELRFYLRRHNRGRVVSNDSGVVTERGPDSVRGADVAYYSYKRVPKGRLRRGYLKAVPELVFEVRSFGDSWKEILAKVAEYLAAGVLRVCVLDERTESARVYSADDPEEVFSGGDALGFPGILPGFAVQVKQFFA